MPVVINGTTGISGVDGSAGTPSYVGGDSDTGLWYPAANTLALSTSGSERLRIDSSGNVGIGTSSPGGRLELFYTDVSNPALRLRYNSTSIYGNHLMDGNGNYIIQAPAANGVTSGNLRLRAGGLFSVSVNDQPATSQALTIDSSGNVGIGTTSPSTYAQGLTVYNTGSSNADITIVKGNSGTANQNGQNLRFYNYGPAATGRNAGTVIGNIYFACSQPTSGAIQDAGQIACVAESQSGNNTASALTFSTNTGNSGNAERMRITSGGNVGIGTNNPVYPLQVSAGSSGSIAFIVNPTGLTNFAVIPSNSGSTGTQIGTTGGDTFAFITNNTERMRIDSSGRLLVNRTTANAQMCLTYAGNSIEGFNINDSASSAGSAAIRFAFGGTGCGGIVLNTNSTTYQTSSDYRLKEDIAPMIGALDKVAQLKPVTYKWKADGSKGQGFIAHELQAVVPECVTGKKDDVETYTDEEGNEQTRIKPQGIDTSFLVATLTAAIQELKGIVDTQATKIAELEAKLK